MGGSSVEGNCRSDVFDYNHERMITNEKINLCGLGGYAAVFTC